MLGKIGKVALVAIFSVLVLVILASVIWRGSATTRSSRPELAAKTTDPTDPIGLDRGQVATTNGDVGRQAEHRDNVAADVADLSHETEDGGTSPGIETPPGRAEPPERPDVDGPFDVESTQSPPQEDASRDDAAPMAEEGEVSDMPSESLIAAQREHVDRELDQADGFSRDDLLAMYGRSAAASGQFELAATAYTMFLEEFGNEHTYSERVAMRLADCLAPLDLDSIDVAHTPAGPIFHPQWRMGYSPRPELLQQAVGAYQRAAEFAGTDAGARRALLRMGWVHRALNEWEASTAAWDRCATEAANTNAAADALWLAAENLSWTGHPALAAERLQRLAAESPDDPRAAAASDRAESLEADARRGAEWLADPVMSLRTEIEQRISVRPAHETYRSALQWLRFSGHRPAQIEVSRWACAQTDWPLQAKLACHHHLIDALLEGDPEDSERLEAAEVLAQIMALSQSDEWTVPAALRRFRLLSELRQFELADRTWDEVATQIQGSPVWEPRVLAERVQSLLDRGDNIQATSSYQTLSTKYPDHDLTMKLAQRLSGTMKEEL